MPWVIGIDEAGYGPNLGPFVMSSVAVQVPDALVGADLWSVLRQAVCRPDEPSENRVVVGDSKQVFSPAAGLGTLEESVQAIVQSALPAAPGDLGEYVALLCPETRAELCQERWFTGNTPLPVEAERPTYGALAQRLQAACAEQGVGWGLIRSVVVCPGRFNALLDRWQSKGAVLGLALVDLLRANEQAIDDREPIFVSIDKHGGRNNYAPVLQHAFADDLVLAHEESRERSVYRVARAAQPVTITIQPRADDQHFTVALASLFSKYLRELLMHEFNRFWQREVPGLAPTAGYPADAARFFAAISPALPRLQLAENAVWRRK